MCGLFSTPSIPQPPQIIEPPPPIIEEEGERTEVGKDLERRRAAARQGFESTWLTRGSRTGVPGGGAATQQPQQPQTVLRKTMGA